MHIGEGADGLDASILAVRRERFDTVHDVSHTPQGRQLPHHHGVEPGRGGVTATYQVQRADAAAQSLPGLVGHVAVLEVVGVPSQHACDIHGHVAVAHDHHGGAETGGLVVGTSPSPYVEQARLRHVATGLHRSLEEARVELERTQAALLRSAAAARESAPTSGAVETVHTDLLNRTLRAASTEGHRVDDVVSRVSSQTQHRLGAIDPVGQAARERIRAHRDLPGGGAGPPAPGVDR
ncbi:hypothetical protein [uncultured Serinicoccus sp.]|uniref:hypothetical protein n=1 Tax=uncultured Serinicoccus sp. TaxID=735514 RepID=UPI00262EF463|nr:hypothetical protein [uncultured Serinicoccus sp.]